MRYNSGRLWTVVPGRLASNPISGNRTAGIGSPNPVSDALATRSQIGSYLRAVGSPRIDDHRSPRGTTGRAKTGDPAECPAVAKEYGSPVALAVREAGGHEAKELARSGPVGTVPGGARGGVSEASGGLAEDPLLVLSQPTLR